MRLKLHPEARADLREGRAFYRHHSPVAALAFTRTIDEAIRQIAEAPERYPVGEYDTRELVLPRRFPYTLVYKIGENVIVIVAVAHQSREPGFWHSRL